MTNQERIDQYNQRVALLTEYGLPVNETLNIDDVGNFSRSCVVQIPVFFGEGLSSYQLSFGTDGEFIHILNLWQN